MAKKTATEGVYMSDEEYKLYQQMRKTLVYATHSFTDSVNLQIEGLIGALVSVALTNKVEKELLLEAVGKVYEYAKNNRVIFN